MFGDAAGPAPLKLDIPPGCCCSGGLTLTGIPRINVGGSFVGREVGDSVVIGREGVP